MKKVINKRYQEIKGKMQPIFPCVELDIFDNIIKAESYFFVHEEDKENKVTKIYVALMKKEYHVTYGNAADEEVIEHFTTQFMMEGCQCLRWYKASDSIVNYAGEPITSLIDTVPESDFIRLSQYI